MINLYVNTYDNPESITLCVETDKIHTGIKLHISRSGNGGKTYTVPDKELLQSVIAVILRNHGK